MPNQTMQLVQTWAELNQVLPAGPRTVVMTMGALHQGHLDLVDQAAQLGQPVVVTIFVNPLQFGPTEDFQSYPRNLQADLAVLEGRGVSAVYAPAAADMYPQGQPDVSIKAGPAGRVFEGAARPGHFDGVLTVVLKLLQRTAATTAIFGQKDAQQLALIQRMVSDLDLGVQIQAVPTRRDLDGLALSSRNQRLSPAARQVALVLPRALEAGASAAWAGQTLGAIRLAAHQVVNQAPAGFELDYLEVVEPSGFTVPQAAYQGPALLIGAAIVDSVRLIDNWPIGVGATG